MPISAARLAANRSNAQLSTGPKSEASKANLFRNRYSHGLTASRMVVADWEDAADYEKLVAALHAEHQPRTPTETILVNRMAEHHWLRGRAVLMQQHCFDFHRPNCFDPAQLALFLRYQTTHERAFARCLAELQKLKKTRTATEVGFESQKRREPEPVGVCAAPPVPANPPTIHLQPQKQRDNDLYRAPGFVAVPHEGLSTAPAPPLA